MLLHISDPHFGTERPQVLEALLRLAHAQQPLQVVLSGDITQRARRVQFRAARRFVERLGAARVLVIPGNHDIPLFNLVARALWPYANYTRALGTDLEPVHDSPLCLVIALNTTRAHRHTNGEVSAQQVERVAQRLLRARPEQLRIVVVHQPVAVPRESDAHDLLRGHSDAVARWAQAGADMVMGGHIHLPYVLPLHERRADLARRIWAVQAGTAVSQRVRGDVPNSVNLLRWGGALPERRCVVERWDYSARIDAFTPVVSTALDTGWL